MKTPGRLLVSRADDAGSATSANHAIRDGVRCGAISAVGFMVPAPAFEDAVATLRDELGEVDVGLHATINAEWDDVRWGPVLEPTTVPSLLEDDGTFTRHPRNLQKGLVVDEIVAEISAQLDALRRAGLDPDYLDTHMGFDWLPGVGAALEELARQEGLHFAARTPPFLPESDTENVEGDLIATWLNRISSAPPGAYQLVTHPGNDSAEMRRFCHPGLEPGQIARERAAEAAALRDPRFRAGLEAAGVRLVRFTSLR